MITRTIVAATVLVLAVPSIAGTLTRTLAVEYDPTSGLLIREIIEPDNSALCVVTTYLYDAYGNRTRATTRNCNGTSSGGVTEASAPAAGSDPVFTSRTSSSAFAAGSVVINAITYNWNAGQFATSNTNAIGHTETRIFDPRFGAVVSLTGPNGITTNWSFDNFGRKVSEIRADSANTTWAYNLCGICPTGGKYSVTATATGAPTSTIYYDMLNRVIRTETQGIDGTLARKDTQFDSLGRVSQVSRPYYAGAVPVWTVFTYDILGRVLTQTEPNNAVTTTAYNGLATTVTNALNQTETRVKNSQGQLIRVIRQ